RAAVRSRAEPWAIAAYGETRSHVCSPEVQPTQSLSGAVSRRRHTSPSSSVNFTLSSIAAVHVTVVPAAHDAVPSVDMTNVSPSISKCPVSSGSTPSTPPSSTEYVPSKVKLASCPVPSRSQIPWTIAGTSSTGSSLTVTGSTMADADGEIGDNRVRFHGSPAAIWHPEREYVASTRPSSGMSSTRKAHASHWPLVTLMMTSVPSSSYVPMPYGSVSRRPFGSNTNEPSAP